MTSSVDPFNKPMLKSPSMMTSKDFLCVSRGLDSFEILLIDCF